MKNLNGMYFQIAVCMAAAFPFAHIMCMQIEQSSPSLIDNDKEVLSGYDCRYLKNLNARSITPENTIFAFDLHEVLFSRSRPKIIWGGFKLFCKSFFYTLFHPTFFCRLLSVASEPMVCEGMFVKLADEYPDVKNWEKDIFEISNGCCYPKKSMINLIKILKAKGFKVFLLSNIGADALSDFRQRFDCIEGLFDGFYTPCRANDYCCKPMLKFYEGFKIYLRSLGYDKEQILFIDDLERNVKAACEAGISGIRFIGYEKLCATLKKLGVQISTDECISIKS